METEWSIEYEIANNFESDQKFEKFERKFNMKFRFMLKYFKDGNTIGNITSSGH